MTDQLREALRDLARDAPHVSASAAATRVTWERARRARRRTIASVAACFVVLLVGSAVAGNALMSEHQTAPAGTPRGATELAIPDQVWLPNSSTPGTADAGPPGPLALMATAPRRTSWFHSEKALFGVSADTGTYRFLDLPSVDPQSGVQPTLSHDGLHIAYFASGNPVSPDAQSSVIGYAVYDTLTAEVHVRRVATDYGLTAQSITWSGDSEILAPCFGQFTARQGIGRSVPGEWWNASTNSVSVAYAPVGDLTAEGPAPEGVARFDAAVHQVQAVDTSGLSGPSTLGAMGLVGAEVVGPPLLSPTGKAIAFLADPDERRQRQPAERLAAAPPDSEARAASDTASKVTLQRALDRLTQKQRTVLVLRFYEDLSEQQTADVMGCRLGTVKSQTRHALMRLRELAPELVDFAPTPSIRPQHQGDLTQSDCGRIEGGAWRRC